MPDNHQHKHHYSACFSSELYKGKTVVVTGAGNGIGFETAIAFHAAGARVIAHLGRSELSKKRLPEKILSIAADLTEREGQDRFCDFVCGETQSVDALIHIAGTMFGRFPADTLSDDDYTKIIELNQTAVVRITRALIPLLADSGDGAIVNTVSISASTGGSAGSSIYSASKAFVSTYTKALSRELAPKKIRVNAVSPGVINTDFHQRYSSAEKLENTRKQIPLQRLGTAEDCAPSYLFLASSALSGYVSGQIIEINGGQY